MADHDPEVRHVAGDSLREARLQVIVVERGLFRIDGRRLHALQQITREVHKIDCGKKRRVTLREFEAARGLEVLELGAANPTFLGCDVRFDDAPEATRSLLLRENCSQPVRLSQFLFLPFDPGFGLRAAIERLRQTQDCRAALLPTHLCCVCAGAVFAFVLDDLAHVNRSSFFVRVGDVGSFNLARKLPLREGADACTRRRVGSFAATAGGEFACLQRG